MAHVNTVNPGDGHRGRDEFPRERDDYRGTHRRADEPEEYGDGYADDRYVDDRYADDRYYDTAYEDAEYVEAEPVEAELVDEEEERRGALGGSTVATGGAAGAAAAGAAGSRDAAAAGIPKRGLGMILLAVGVLLALWAVFALNKGDDSPSNTAEETQSSQASDAAQPNGADGNGAKNGANNGAAAPVPGQENTGQDGDAQNPDAQNPDAQNPDANTPDANTNGDAGETAPAAPANNPATPGLTAQDAQVYVFNNSGVPELANKTAGELGGQYHVANQSQDPAAMNMPEQTFGVFPETYVFYNPQVAGADQVAAEVAQRVGGTPRANNDLPDAETQLPSEAIQNRNAITVVLAGR